MTMINSPFRYAGGKFYARKFILELLPLHTYYVEPFAGGGSVFFAKQKVQSNLLNDADDELINCYTQIRDNVEDLISLLAGEKASKDRHTYFKHMFKPQNELERAYRWYYLNRTSFSGIMNMANCYWGYDDKYSMPPKNWAGHLRRCAAKLQHIILTCHDFEQIIDDVPDGAFLFVDPPYFNADQNKFYTHSFSYDDHDRLAHMLKTHRNRITFLLTYDNSPKIHELYHWADHILEREWTYTINRTDDQTKKTTRRGKRYQGREIFIANYPHVSETNQYVSEQLTLVEE